MEKPIKYTSPFGKAIYPHLNSPDVKFKAEGEYHLKLELGDKDAKEVLKVINETLDNALEDEKKNSKKKNVTKSSHISYKKEDGKHIFSFKMKAKGFNKKNGEAFTQKPALFDNELKPLDPDLQIWGGSNLRVSYTPYGWYKQQLGGAGVTLRLKSVQVKDLVQGSSSNGGGHGFTKTDGNSSEKNVSTDEMEEEVAEATNSADF